MSKRIEELLEKIPYEDGAGDVMVARTCMIAHNLAVDGHAKTGINCSNEPGSIAQHQWLEEMCLELSEHFHNARLATLKKNRNAA